MTNYSTEQLDALLHSADVFHDKIEGLEGNKCPEMFHEVYQSAKEHATVEEQQWQEDNRMAGLNLRYRDHLLAIDHEAGTQRFRRGIASKDLVGVLDGMLYRVAQPIRLSLIEHVLIQIASPVYNSPHKLTTFLDAFLSGLVASQEHVERLKEFLIGRATVLETGRLDAADAVCLIAHE